MTTVLEELLIKIGFDVDQKGLREAQDSIHDDLNKSAKSTKAQGKKNKSLENQADALEDIGKQKKKNQRQDENTDDDEQKREQRQKSMNKILGDAKGLLGGISKGWVAAGVAAAAYTIKIAKSNDATAKFSRSMGISSDELQGFQFAAEQNGSTAEAVTSTMANLTSVIGAAAWGDYNRGLSLMGININKAEGGLKTGADLIFDISEAIKGFDPARQVSLLSMIGVDPSLLPMLQEGRFAMRDLLKEREKIGVETKTQLETSEKLNDESNRWVKTLKSASKEAREATTAITTGLIQFSRLGISQGIKGIIAPGTISGAAREEEKARINAEFKAQTTGGLNNINATINVNGVQDPAETARMVKRELLNEVKQSANNADKSGEL